MRVKDEEINIVIKCAQFTKDQIVDTFNRNIGCDLADKSARIGEA